VARCATVQAVSDLTQTQIFDKEQNVGLLYKLMKIASITISSTMGSADTPVRCCHCAPTRFSVRIASRCARGMPSTEAILNAQVPIIEGLPIEIRVRSPHANLASTHTHTHARTTAHAVAIWRAHATN
jgi:hypothetical protein